MSALSASERGQQPPSSHRCPTSVPPHALGISPPTRCVKSQPLLSLLRTPLLHRRIQVSTSACVPCLRELFQWCLWAAGRAPAPSLAVRPAHAPSSSESHSLPRPRMLQQPACGLHSHYPPLKAVLLLSLYLDHSLPAPNLRLCGLSSAPSQASIWAAPPSRKPCLLLGSSARPSLTCQAGSQSSVKTPQHTSCGAHTALTWSARLSLAFSPSQQWPRHLHLAAPELTIVPFPSPKQPCAPHHHCWRDCTDGPGGQAEDKLPSSSRQRGSGESRQSLPGWLGWNFLLEESGTVSPLTDATASQPLWGTLTVLG